MMSTDTKILIPKQELREDDLQVGVRVHVTWDPTYNKPEAIGQIVEVRHWKGEFPQPEEADYDVIIRVLDEQSGMIREASLADEWIDVIAPSNS